MQNRHIARLAAALLCAFVLVPSARAQNLTGLWDGIVVANKVDVPFPFEIVAAGGQVEGFFFEGDRRIGSTGGSFDGKTLKLEYEFLNTVLEATFDGTALKGTYRNRRPNARPQEFRATRFVPTVAAAPTGDVPQVAGSYAMYRATASDRFKLDVSWRLYLRQNGVDVSGAILRTSGDTGTLVGRWKDGRLVMSHFAGDRPLVFEAETRPDGTLFVTLDKDGTYRAAKVNEAMAKGIPDPPDLTRFTSVKDPSERFHFSGIGLDGRTLADTDAQFQGKVVILTLGGTWCPNCHDEAPSLVELSKEFRAQGLEVAALLFENDPDISAARPRIQSFIRRYGIEYPMLVAGGREDGPKRLPQLVNFSVYPTTVILGRDGRVRQVHAGFASAATGDEHTKLKRDRRELVQRLLREPDPTRTPNGL